MKRVVLVCLVCLLLGPGLLTSLAPPPPAIVVFESPSAAVLQALAAARHLDVRWVETGLVVAEIADATTLDPGWQGRVVAARPHGRDLALLRAPEIEGLRRSGHTGVMAVLEGLRLGTARAGAGEVWVLGGAPDAWPAEVLGCHGGLVFPAHGLDPRSLLDAGPPAALRPWIGSPPHKPTAAQRRLVEAVSEDSLAATLARLTRDGNGDGADRHVFGADLDGLYSPRVEAMMARALAGIGHVRRESFAKSRRCSGITRVDSTYNVIARIPGRVPGTGTFVICAHIDATGSRNSDWLLARGDCRPVGPTPGAEDNASGVACMLEVLRLVGDGMRDGSLDFAFDLEFIAFSGEEFEGSEGGLTGSTRYVANRVQEGTQMLAAFNLDMVGSDSLGKRLQVVHNTASRWLADLLLEAAGAVVPPIDLDLRRELDESLASDHNSFWAVNVPALLGADAPVAVLRNYATYHRPRDTGVDVRTSKMVEVARTFLAALLRFERTGQTEPALLNAVQLFIAPQGVPLEYDATEASWRLWPDSPLRLQAVCTLHSTGAPYGGPLRVEIGVESAAGKRQTLFDCSDAACFAGGGGPPLQTGDRLDLRLDPVPILPEDAGQNQVFMRVTYDSSGTQVVNTATARFDVAAQVGLAVQVRPNPARSLEAASLYVRLERPGTLRTDVYSAAGRRVATHVTSVQPNLSFRTPEDPIQAVPLLGVASPADVPSGVYFARVHWTGPGGQQETTVVRLAVVR